MWRLGIIAVLVLGAGSAFATTWNVKNGCNGGPAAMGNGTHDDTTAINDCIAALANGDTLEFPAGTYLVSALNPINVSNVTIDGSSNTATILSTTSQNGPVVLIGQSGFGTNSGSPVCASGGNAAIKAGSSLSATANEQATTFTTASTLSGISAGSYVLLQQGGIDGNYGGGGPSSPTECDTSGCRQELVNITNVSGNTYTVATMLHDTWSTANAAVACPVIGMISGVVLQNITISGGTTTAQTAGNHFGLFFNDCVNCTISGVTVENTLGSAFIHTADYGDTFTNLTITGAGSENCGAALQGYANSNLTLNTISLSSLNPSTNLGPCLADGAFGLEEVAMVNSVTTGVTVNSSGTGGGRPMKITASRWNTNNSLTVENGVGAFNGLSFEYYSSHNLLNACTMTGNAGGSGNAGINLFGSFNQYNTLYNCTVTGNGNVQLYDSCEDISNLGEDSNNSVLGGTYTGTSGSEPPILIQGANWYIAGATINGPGDFGALYLGGANSCSGTNTGATNACSANNSLCSTAGVTGNVGLYNSFSSDDYTGNTLGHSCTISGGTSTSCPSTSQGAGAQASLNHASLSFGNQTVETTSSPQTITLTNGIGSFSGTSTLTFVEAAYLQTGTQFSISANTCTSTVASGGTCTVSVKFSPTTTGAQTDNLIYLDSASGAWQVVPLAGTGTLASGTYFAPTAEGAGNGTSCANAYAIFDATHGLGVSGTWTAGATLHLCGGTYTGGAAATSYIVAQNSGSSGNPITLIADQGAAIFTSTSWGGPVINLAGHSYVTINGDNNLTIQATLNGTSGGGCPGGGCTSQTNNGMCVNNGSPSGNSSNIIIEGIKCQNLYVISSAADNGGEGTYGFFVWNVSNLQILTNTCSYAKWCDAESYAIGGTYSGLVISGNTFENMDHGIFTSASDSSGTVSMSGVTISGNTFGSMTAWDNTADNNHHDWMHISSNGATMTYSNVWIYDNVGIGDVGANANAGIYMAEENGSASGGAYNNVFVNTATNHCWANGYLLDNENASPYLFANNTMVSNVAHDACTNNSETLAGDNGIVYDSSSNLTAENNIFVAMKNDNFYSEGTIAISAIDYNDWYNGEPFWTWAPSGGTAVFSTWQADCDCDAHSILTNPTLNSSSSPPYQLANSSSPAYRTGTNLTSAYCGTEPALCTGAEGNPRPSSGAWDMGAYYTSGQGVDLRKVSPPRTRCRPATTASRCCSKPCTQRMRSKPASTAIPRCSKPCTPSTPCR